MKKALKIKSIWAILSMLAGIYLLSLSMVLHAGSIVTTSFAFAMIGVSVARLISIYRMHKNPKALQAYEIGQKEERFLAISEKSGRFVFLLTIMAEFVAIFTLILQGKEGAATIVSYVAGAQAVVYLATYFYLCKKY